MAFMAITVVEIHEQFVVAVVSIHGQETTSRERQELTEWSGLVSATETLP